MILISCQLVCREEYKEDDDKSSCPVCTCFFREHGQPVPRVLPCSWQRNVRLNAAWFELAVRLATGMTNKESRVLITIVGYISLAITLSCMLLWLSKLGHPIQCEFLVVLWNPSILPLHCGE